MQWNMETRTNWGTVGLKGARGAEKLHGGLATGLGAPGFAQPAACGDAAANSSHSIRSLATLLVALGTSRTLLLRRQWANNICVACTRM